MKEKTYKIIIYYNEKMKQDITGVNEKEIKELKELLKDIHETKWITTTNKNGDIVLVNLEQVNCIKVEEENEK